MKRLLRLVNKFLSFFTRRQIPGAGTGKVSQKELLASRAAAMRAQNMFRDIIARTQYLTVEAAKQSMLDTNPDAEDILVTVRVSKSEDRQVVIEVETSDNFKGDPPQSKN